MNAERSAATRVGWTLPAALVGLGCVVVALWLVHRTAATRAACGGLGVGACGRAKLQDDAGHLLMMTGLLLLGAALVAAYGRALAARAAGTPWSLPARLRASRPRTRVVDLEAYAPDGPPRRDQR